MWVRYGTGMSINKNGTYIIVTVSQQVPGQEWPRLNWQEYCDFPQLELLVFPLHIFQILQPESSNIDFLGKERMIYIIAGITLIFYFAESRWEKREGRM